MRGPTVREILFPTDFSDASAVAGRTAADFARHFGARLHVLHVVPSGFGVEPPRPTLDNAVAALGAGLRVRPVVEAGLAASVIIQYARAHRIDLVVMGTHGRTGFSHALLGSVAEAVVRRTPCPVLTVPTVPPPVPAAPPPATPAEALAPSPGRCIVCAEPSPDLICGHCRARIRGEALERKWNDERAARMASR